MTVWLSRLTLDPRSMHARRDTEGAGGPIRLHRRVMSLFPDGAGCDARSQFGVLFRVEETPDGVQVLLQSNHQPDPTRLPTDYGILHSRPLDPLLDALKQGLTIRYRCVVSPVRKPGATTRELYNLPAVVALTGSAADEWWMRQAEQIGVAPLTAHAHPLPTVQGQRGNDGPAASQRIRHTRTRFEGTATITDPQQLRTKIIEGIGRGKPYGCGLLTIAPARTPA